MCSASRDTLPWTHLSINQAAHLANTNLLQDVSCSASTIPHLNGKPCSTGTQGQLSHPPLAPGDPGTPLQPRAAQVQSVLSDSQGSFQEVCVAFKNTRLLGDLNTETCLCPFVTPSEIQDLLYDFWGESLGFFLPEVQFKPSLTCCPLSHCYGLEMLSNHSEASHT